MLLAGCWAIGVLPRMDRDHPPALWELLSLAGPWVGGRGPVQPYTRVGNEDTSHLPFKPMRGLALVWGSHLVMYTFF